MASADELKKQAADRWAEIISRLTGLPESILDTKHHPCPKCGGEDRFNLDRDGSGSIFCNQCQPRGTGSGIDAIMWLNSWDFPRAKHEIDTYLNPPQPITDDVRALRHATYTKLATVFPLSDKHTRDLDKRGLPEVEIQHRGYWSAPGQAHLKLMANFDSLGKVEIAKSVPGVMPGGSLTLAARDALMIPVRNADGEIVGLQYRPDKRANPKSPKYLWLSSKDQGVSPGSPCHFALAPADRECQPGTIRLTEGPLKADIATALSGVRTLAIAGVNNWKVGVAAVQSLNPSQVWLAFDSDALTNTAVARATVDSFDALTASGLQVHFEAWDGDHKGIDDALAAGVETNVLSLDETNKRIEILRKLKNLGPRDAGWVNEAEDDPQRLARVNLKTYEDGHNGKLVYWRDEWWKWKAGKYRRIEPSELRAKVWQSIRTEFERCWRERLKAGDDKPIRKVTKSLVGNVIGAMESMCCIASSIPMPCWMPDRTQRHYVSTMNGILDLDAVFRKQPLDEWMVEHSPEWFSAFRLDYAFDPNADCPKWIEYLEYCMDGDQEKIAILQEWAGYLLTGSNELQKFLVLEGEGGNGKTVFFSGMTAMLGEDNVSHVSIENFGGRFELGTTIGKSANISGDAGEIDGIAEGVLKQFTGGDIMQFDRKNLSPISARPTAKLMAAWNGRPRIKDKSMGLWRRMLLVPFNRKIEDHRKVLGMDTPGWWLKQGEAPGILLWAIAGLYRLRQQGGFTRSKSSDAALMEYREESNPAMRFLSEKVSWLPPEILERESAKEASEQMGVKVDDLYFRYKEWCRDESVMPLAKQNFGKQIVRQFGDLKHRRGGRGDRYFVYRLLTVEDDDF
jgi:P4 family phage/plasmid primase-like protien